MVGIVVGDLKLLMYIEYYLFTVHYVHRVLPPKVKIDRQADRFNVFSGTQKITKKRILAPAKSVDRFAKKIDRSADRQIDRFDFLGHSIGTALRLLVRGRKLVLRANAIRFS